MKKQTFWAKENITRPTKRYVLLFNLYNSDKRTSTSSSEFDNIHEADEEAKELNAMYKDHALPKKIEYVNGIPRYEDNATWWGYIVLDMKDCRCVRCGGHGFQLSYWNIIKQPKKINSDDVNKDYFFRDITVCPDDYDFDDGEYNGWLRFRWGDGANAIGYEKPRKIKSPKKTIEKVELNDEDYYDNIQSEYDRMEEKRLLEKSW